MTSEYQCQSSGNDDLPVWIYVIIGVFSFIALVVAATIIGGGFIIHVCIGTRGGG